MRKQGGCLGEAASLAEEPGQNSSFNVDLPLPAPVGRGGKRGSSICWEVGPVQEWGPMWGGHGSLGTFLTQD